MRSWQLAEDPEIPRLQEELNRRYLHRSIRVEVVDRGEEAVNEILEVIEEARILRQIKEETGRERK